MKPPTLLPLGFQSLRFRMGGSQTPCICMREACTLELIATNKKMQCPKADPVQTIACWNIILLIKGERAVRLKRFAGGELGIMTGSPICRLARKSRQVGLSTWVLERFYVVPARGLEPRNPH